MKLSDYMNAMGAAPATGERIGRQMVLAVDCSEAGSETEGEYAVVAYHFENVGASLSAGTVDKSYIGEGESTVKTSTQRTFSLSGQRLVGEEFQDFCCGHAIKYGTGSEVQRKYVYFDSGTKKGEKGTCTIIVKNDGSAAAGNPTDVQIDLNVNGVPEEFEWKGAAS